MNRQEATKILMEQADYWRSLIKRNGVDGYPDHRLHTVVAGLDWAVDYMSGNAPTDGTETRQVQENWERVMDQAWTGREVNG